MIKPCRGCLRLVRGPVTIITMYYVVCFGA